MVLSYFVKNPQMADTLEGIVRWRLMEESLHERVLETEAAVRKLIAAHLLIEERRVGSERLYRLNLERLSDAAKLLAMAPAPARRRPARKR